MKKERNIPVVIVTSCFVCWLAGISCLMFLGPVIHLTPDDSFIAGILLFLISCISFITTIFGFRRLGPLDRVFGIAPFCLAMLFLMPLFTIVSRR